MILSRSLDGNCLCDLYLQYGTYGDLMGTYTSEGIDAICKGLKSSSITSLRCAGCPLHHVKARGPRASSAASARLPQPACLSHPLRLDQ